MSSMNVLTIFEQRISAIFEEGAPGQRKPFSFRRLAKRAVREMEDETFVIDGVDTAPALYTVLVSATDDELMRPMYARICDEVSQLVEAQAKKRGYTFVGRPLVRFMVDPALRKGRFSVFAENVDPRTLARLRDEENAYLGLIAPRNIAYDQQFVPEPVPVVEDEPAPIASEVPFFDQGAQEDEAFEGTPVDEYVDEAYAPEDVADSYANAEAPAKDFIEQDEDFAEKLEPEFLAEEDEFAFEDELAGDSAIRYAEDFVAEDDVADFATWDNLDDKTVLANDEVPADDFADELTQETDFVEEAAESFQRAAVAEADIAQDGEPSEPAPWKPSFAVEAAPEDLPTPELEPPFAQASAAEDFAEATSEEVPLEATPALAVSAAAQGVTPADEWIEPEDLLDEAGDPFAATAQSAVISAEDEAATPAEDTDAPADEDAEPAPAPKPVLPLRRSRFFSRGAHYREQPEDTLEDEDEAPSAEIQAPASAEPQPAMATEPEAESVAPQASEPAEQPHTAQQPAAAPTPQPAAEAQPAPTPRPMRAAQPKPEPMPMGEPMTRVIPRRHTGDTCTLTDTATGRKYHVIEHRTPIGRERVEGGIVLRDPNVSRRHAELLYDNGVWAVRDLNSTNGTLVDDMDVHEAVLTDGDVITIGLTNLEFRVG